MNISRVDIPYSTKTVLTEIFQLTVAVAKEAILITFSLHVLTLSLKVLISLRVQIDAGIKTGIGVGKSNKILKYYQIQIKTNTCDFVLIVQTYS